MVGSGLDSNGFSQDSLQFHVLNYSQKSEIKVRPKEKEENNCIFSEVLVFASVFGVCPVSSVTIVTKIH